MALAAAQVVDALAALLVPVSATAGRVYTSRTHPLTEDNLPCWRVFVAEEQVDPVELGARINQHLLQVNAEATVRAVADADDAINALAAQGLAALFAGTPANDLQLIGIDRDFDGEGEAALARVRLRLQARIHVAAATPETIIS
jgi:hypothetical protein